MSPLKLASIIALSLGVMMPRSDARSRDTHSDAAFLLVANKAEHTLGIIDPKADRQIATVPEGGITGHEVIASPTAAPPMSRSMAIRALASPAPTGPTW